MIPAKIGNYLTSPLSRTTLAADTFTLLKEAITSGRIAPGERLVEARLAEELGVSRVPVREALRQLKQEGLIVYFVHRGYFVPVFNLDDLEELFMVRMALEKMAAQLAIARMTFAELTKLESIVQKMESVGENELDRTRETEWDTAFHEQLCISSHSQRLLKIWGDMSHQIRMAILASNQSFRVSSGFASGHREILEALRVRDLPRATKAIEQHLTTGLKHLKEEIPNGKNVL
jgi:DNA-binding GntR family transcriptional regulator